eukprot:gene7486-biopygen6351
MIWVGPPPAAINAMGLKDAAKSLMIAAGVPTTPGYLGDDQSEVRLEAEAAAIGFSVVDLKELAEQAPLDPPPAAIRAP